MIQLHARRIERRPSWMTPRTRDDGGGAQRQTRTKAPTIQTRNKGPTMTLDLAQTITLLGGTIATGLMAGVFSLYAHTIMRGLGATDDRTFVGAFQAIDRAIINPIFMATFFGAFVLDGAAAALQLGQGGHGALAWTIAAVALYLSVVAITVVVHVPLNDRIKAAGDAREIADVAPIRVRFQETRWATWNTVRAAATTIAFGCLTWALVLQGRTT